ncbi:hypothetical protein KY349_00620 [Candidatus Woesearchaeota archaeon]|jgi:chromosome segregation ATPase|nr:hypothetical protein [Candidatus Woesearchaeota archaeon]
MAGKKSVIETGVDKLVKLVSEYKKISVKDAAKELGVSVSSVEEWADFLEEEGIISIQAKFATVYLVEKKLSKKDLVEKVKTVRAEKESFVRRIESSINALERDHEEIKLIDSEFKQIKSLLEDKFLKLSKKLDKLEDFKKSHHQIGVRCNELEKDYEEKLKNLDSKLKKEERSYREVLAKVEEELENIKKERDKVTHMIDTEKDLHLQVEHLNKQIGHIRDEIEKENKQLDIDDQRLKKSADAAEGIKKDIESTSKDLDEVSKQFTASRKEIESMEKTFLKDVESLKTGDLDKIGSYKESREVVDRFRKFFDQTREIEGLIHKAEKEEEELKEHFEKLAKKVQAFTAVTSVPEIKNEMGSLQNELAEIESRKKLLAVQLMKLRNVVRSVIK